MLRFRRPTSSSPADSGLPTTNSSPTDLSPSGSFSSTLSAADSVPSSASNSSILSLLQARSSGSLSTALSSATSVSSLPTEPSLTAQTPSVPPTATKSPGPTQVSSGSAHISVSPRKKLSNAAVPSRESLTITSSGTSRPSTTTTSRDSSISAGRRSSVKHITTEHRRHTAVMAKKAKVGSAAKSSPFTKRDSTPTSLTASSAEADQTAAESTTSSVATAVSSLPNVAENEAPSSPESTTPTPPTKPIETPVSSSESKQNVVVCVRMRPSRGSSSSAEPLVWNCDTTKNQITPTEHHPAIAKRTTSSERAGAGASIAAAPSAHELDGDDASTSTYRFQFDKLITDGQTSDDMYHSHIAPVVRAAMEGYNGTVFAYGQTGSGKTHTMSGSNEEPGVIPRAVQQVFQMINDEPDREFLLRVSYLEIYNETLKDLLAPLPPLSSLTGASTQTTDRPASPIKGGSTHAAGQSQSSTLRIIEDQKQSRVLITGLREEIVTDADTVLSLLQRGQDERHVGATDWNERSSRSHCVFQLTIESRARDALAAGKEVRISQLNLIDLAGSERAASQAERRKEGAFINKSLLTLGTVIGKLTEPSDTGDAHIPYRDSKLTRILQTSLSGNARIAVICTLSPDPEHANETLSTLKFGKRCKLVVTTAKKGTAMDDKALLQKYRKELDALRAKLEANSSSPGPQNTIMETVSPELSVESQQKLEELNQQKEAAKKEIEDMQKKRSDLKSQIEHLTRLILTSQSVAAEDKAIAGPSTPVRARSAHATALVRRGPRMSDLHSLYNSPVAGPSNWSNDESTLSGTKPFELEAELAALRRQLRQQIESRQTLITAHQAELAARDARQAELQEAIRINEEELDEAEVAYDKLREERDEARQIALKEQEKARENRKKLLEEQETNRLLKLVAKARADDEDKALQNQIDALRDQLSAKVAEADTMRKQLESELEQARKAVELERAARAQAEQETAESDKAKEALQAELDGAKAQTAELKEKNARFAQSADEDDVTAEFQDLVRGKRASKDDQATSRLKELEVELNERNRQLEGLRAELEQTRRALEAKPQSQAPSQSPDTIRELEHLRDVLNQSQEERQSLQVELAKVRAAKSRLEQDSQRISSLDSELARANAKIIELEKEVLAQKTKVAEALNTVARQLPVPSSVLDTASNAARSWGGGSVPSSPIKAFTAGGSKLRMGGGVTTPTSNVEASGLNRAGSVKEYRRYQAGDDTSSPASPMPASGARSAILSHEARFGDARSALTSGALKLQSNKAEQEEIERLNAVINSQRAIMADLEKSVASWKTRMKAQAELIEKLVVQNNGGTVAGSGGQSPPTSDAENEDRFGGRVLSSPRRKLLDGSGDGGERFNSLPRTTRLTLREASQNGSDPYYGAHTYNRPPPTVSFGTLPGSPQKGFSGAYSAHTWSASSPSPLPLPQSGSPSPSKRKPRKTIEMDLKLLQSSPRVESNKSKFSLDALTSQDTPTKRRATNASAYYI